MKFAFAAVVMLACLGAEPATRPSKEQQAAVLREQIARVEAVLADLKSRLAALEGSVDRSKFTAAAKRGDLLVGMTPEEAKEAMRDWTSEVTYEEDDTFVVAFTLVTPSHYEAGRRIGGGSKRVVTATFRNQKLIDIQR